MAPADRVQADNVIPFRGRPARGDVRPIMPRTAAEIIAEAIFTRLGTADLFNYAVQDAVNGVLGELQRYWRTEAEQAARGQIAEELSALKAELARRATDQTGRPSLALVNMPRT